MGKLLARTMLTSAMGFAWDNIANGERTVARSEAVGITDPQKPYAGFMEMLVCRKGRLTVSAGERLEVFVNWCGMKLGYNDGEVSGWVADGLRSSAVASSLIVEPVSA